MNKRFLSTLLTGAIFLAATSMFVSCKDYDDDIKNLQAQIDKAALKADLEALQTKLSQVEATANAAATKAELKALADAAATKTELDAVKTIAENAGTKAAQAISDAAKAQNAADAAQAFAETVKTTADAAKALAEAAATKDDLATAKTELTGLISKAQETADAAKKLAEAAATKTELKEAVDKLTEAAGNAQKTADEALEIAKAAATKADFDKAVETLTKAAADAQATADEAKKLAEAAATKTELADAKDELKKFAEKVAGEAYTNALSDAKAHAEKLVKDQKDAQALVDAAQNTALETLATELRGKIREIETDIDALEAADEATAKRIDQIVKNYDAQIANLFSAVTSVSLYISGYNDDHQPVELLFPYATELENVFPAAEGITDKQYTFTKGKNATLENQLMIRVSPTNAVLSADMISLINSKGEAIDPELISVTAVEPYEELLTRGAAVSNSGLWTVSFKLKDDFKESELAAAVEKDQHNIIFAVAVNNTPEDAAGRNVVSEYDITVDAGIATPAYNFTVNDTSVAQIHNRFNMCDDGTSTNNVPELNWKRSTASNPTPAVVATEANSGDRIYGPNGYDNRQGETILGVVKGEKIYIDFDELADFKAIRGFYVTLDQDFALESQPSENNAWTSYEYENVGYVDANGKVVPAVMQDGNSGYIVINDTKNVKGDIIGFRVYAVNLDGTLYDPDGRAFYVKVGETVVEKTLDPVEVTISTQGYDAYYGYGEQIFDIPEGTFSNEVKYYYLSWGSNNPFVRGGRDNNPQVEDEDAFQSNIEGIVNGEFITPVEGTGNLYMNQQSEVGTRHGQYFDLNNGQETPIIKVLFSIDGKEFADINEFEGQFDKITKGKAIMTHANRLLDDATYHLVLEGFNEQQEGYYWESVTPIDVINFYITKRLPEFPEGLTVKEGQLKDNTLKVYMRPLDNWQVYDKYDADGNLLRNWAVSSFNGRGNQFYGADIYGFDLADIFNAVQAPEQVTIDGYVLPTFTWVFNGSDKTGDKVVPTYSVKGYIYSRDNTTYYNYYQSSRANSYTIPWVEESFINDGKAKDVDAEYTWYNLSLTQQRIAGTSEFQPLIRDVVTEKKNVFKVEYLCAMNHAGFSLNEDAKFEIPYGATSYDIDLNLVDYTAITLPPYMNPESTGLTQYETLGAMINEGIVKITDAKIANEDYFKVDNEGNQISSAITLKYYRSTYSPDLPADVTTKVTVTFENVFGHKGTVEIPVTIKAPVVEP